ncbi:hypothetical protein EC988_000337 [Linderina pennispora]|nr:hypothetical protein EC988_000337 [Linderina pennispora]
MPISSTVWVPGEQGTVGFRHTGTHQSYEIDLVEGEVNNAQVVHVFDSMAEPVENGLYSVKVDVPSDIPDGAYTVRVGMPNGSFWACLQMFAISARGKSKNNSGAASSAAMTHLDSLLKEPAHTEDDAVPQSRIAENHAVSRHPWTALGMQIAMGAILVAVPAL